MTNQTSIELIDKLGVLKAQIAELARIEKEIKDRLADLGPGAHEGDLYRLTITHSVRETLDMEAVREKLSRQFILAHTRQTDVTTFRVVARTGKAVAA